MIKTFAGKIAGNNVKLKNLQSSFFFSFLLTCKHDKIIPLQNDYKISRCRKHGFTVMERVQCLTVLLIKLCFFM